LRDDDPDVLGMLLSAQAALRSRFDDFRRALDRRDEAAYRLALSDFHENLRRWTTSEQRALLPALLRTELVGRDPRREVSLEHVQLRELTRQIQLQIEARGRLADILGYVENLSRRLAAHESEMQNVYYPAAAPLLTPEERSILRAAAPSP